MPKQYERIRDSVYAQNLKKGMKPKEAYDKAQAIGAATYNKTHKSNPVGRYSK